MGLIERPYVLFVAETVYSDICLIKKKNPNFSNKESINEFIETERYNEISSGKFHDDWLKDLEKNDFIDSKTKKKIPKETFNLLKIQRDLMIKQLIKFPDLYYTKDNMSLDVSSRAFEHLWRLCESYELWCKETNQSDLIILNILKA